MAGFLRQASGAPRRFVEVGRDTKRWVQVHQIDTTLGNTPGTLQFVESGDLRILATISGNPDRDPGAPEIQSVAELG